MKKFLGAILLFLITNLSVLSADMRFVQIESLLYNDSKSEMFKKMVSDINKLKNVNFVIFSGNNISKPNQKDLENFLNQAKSLKTPYYIVLGNKDVNKQKDLSKTTYTKILSKKVKTHRKIDSPNYTFEKKGILFIVVDGSKDVIPSSMGYYKSEVLLWLEEQLETNTNKKVVILQHFPLIPPSNKESHYTYKSDEYLDILSKYTNVKAVISGHFNVNNEKTVNNILHISTADAPNYRIIDILDYDSENPIFWSTIKN